MRIPKILILNVQEGCLSDIVQLSYNNKDPGFGMASKLAGRALEPAGRASDTSGRASE